MRAASARGLGATLSSRKEEPCASELPASTFNTTTLSSTRQ
jgi:hypothetical protein